MDSVILTNEPIRAEEFLKMLPAHPCCGAVVTFAGVVRNYNNSEAVCGIEYECFEAMARKELEQIVREVKQRWDVHQLRVIHRAGVLDVGEISLLIIATAPHRQDAFVAAQFLIDELKHRVPIWKKEMYADGNKEWLRKQ